MVGERDVLWRAATNLRSPVRTSASDTEEEDLVRWMVVRRFDTLFPFTILYYTILYKTILYDKILEILLRLHEVALTTARHTVVVSGAWRTNAASSQCQAKKCVDIIPTI